jgi:hypothetical protein
VPFAEEGIAAGEPVILGYDERKSALLRSWLSDPSAVEFVGDGSLYAKPARAIAAYRRLFEFHAAMGAGQIRIAGDVPHPGNGEHLGMGLWVTHQLDTDVTLRYAGDGFTVRLRHLPRSSRPAATAGSPGGLPRPRRA